MFIIFGWRKILKNFGIVFKNMCDNCHNEKYWVLTRVSRWFTLFFIPVLPTSSVYFLSCPVCKYGIKLNGEQVQKFKPIAEANTLLANGTITQQEYQERLGPAVAIQKVATTSEVAIPELASTIVSSDTMVRSRTLASFCAHCGARALADEKFCGQCGKLLNSS
jgi:hypothetical protein